MPLGRILLKSISGSKKLSELKSDTSRLLYTWLLPHLDVNGCFSGDAAMINGQVFTRLGKGVKQIEDSLIDLENNKLIIRYEGSGDVFLIVPDFVEKQPALHPEREGKTTVPTPTPDQLMSKSGVNPDEVPQKLSKDKLSTSKDKISTEEDKLREDKLNTCPPQKVFELYKSICTAPKLYKPKLLSESRRAKIRTRNVEIARIIKEGGGNETIEQIWTQIFTTVNKNGFLNGNTPSTNPKYANFRADLDWLLENDKGYLKVLEGKYKDSVKRNLREPSPRSEFSGGKVDMRKVMKKQFGR